MLSIFLSFPNTCCKSKIKHFVVCHFTVLFIGTLCILFCKISISTFIISGILTHAAAKSVGYICPKAAYSQSISLFIYILEIMQNRRILIASLLCMAGLQVQAQNQQYDWSVQHKPQRSASLMTVQHVKADKWGNVYSIGTFTDSVRMGGTSNPLLHIAAQTTSGTGQYDLFIMKQDADSNLLWTKQLEKRSFKFNDIYNQPRTVGLEVDDNGNIYLAATFPGAIDVDPGPTDLLLTAPTNTLTTTKDAFVAKYDSAGNIGWVKHFTKNSVLWFAPYYRATDINLYHLTLDKQGKLYVSGVTQEAVLGDTLTIDPGGLNYQKVFTNTVAKNHGFWARMDTTDGTFEKIQFTKSEQQGNMFRFSVRPYDDGTIYAVGQVSDTFDIGLEGAAPHLVHSLVNGSLNYNAYVAKYDTSGATLWAHVLEAKRSTPTDVSVDAQKNLIVYGNFEDSIRMHDNGTYSNSYVQKRGLFVCKFNSAGNLVWEDKPDFSLINDDEFTATNISLDAFDNVYIAGSVKGKINPGALASTVYTHAFVRKYEQAGTIDWTMRYANTLPLTPSENQAGNVVHVDGSNNLYVAGIFRNHAFTINPLEVGNAISIQPGTLATNIVAKYVCADTFTTVLNEVACNEFVYGSNTYTESGVYKHHYWSNGGCDSNVVLHLTINQIAEPFITINNFELGVTSLYDTYQWILDGQLLAGATQSTYTVLANGNYRVITGLANGCSDTSDVYTVTNVTSIDDVTYLAKQIEVYPNPSNGVLTIISPITVDLKVLSVVGSVLSEHKNANKVMLPNSNGIYLLQLFDKDGRLIKVEKVVKQ